MGLLGFYKVMLTRSHPSICQVLRICAGKERTIASHYHVFAPSLLAHPLDWVIDPRNHPIMLHCSHGKDRTGVTTAVLLAILGAPRDSVSLKSRTCPSPSLTSPVRSSPTMCNPMSMATRTKAAHGLR